MNRRSFFGALAKVAAAFTILPAATTYARIWTPTQTIVTPKIWDCSKYVSYIYDRVPHYDEDIIKDWFPDPSVWTVKIDPYPIRYEKDPITGLFSRVPDIIQTPSLP